MLQNRRIDRVGREGVFGVYDSKRTVLFERCRIITEFIEQYAKGPDIYSETHEAVLASAAITKLIIRCRTHLLVARPAIPKEAQPSPDSGIVTSCAY